MLRRLLVVSKNTCASLPPLVFSLLVIFCELAKLSRRAWLLGRRETSWYEYYEEFFQSLALMFSI